MEKNTQKTLSNTELSSFCTQMAMILHAGISSMEGISIMLEDASSDAEKQILQTIHDQLLETGVLMEALKASGVFPFYFLQMVQIGEQTGRLDDVMDSLARHYEREENISSAVRSAVTYPLIMISMMLVIVLVLLIKVLPIFHQIFSQLGFEMNALSRSLMNVGSAISRYSSILILLMAALVIGVFLLTRTPRGIAYLKDKAARIRLTKDYYHKMAACRFASGLALSLSSGLTPEEGIELAEALTDNSVFQESLKLCKKEIAEGKPFAEALSEAGIFPGVYARMVMVGDRTGALDGVLQNIAAQYEEDLDGQIQHIVGVLEPTLVIILSVVVGLILLSVMLPLMGILSGL